MTRWSDRQMATSPDVPIVLVFAVGLTCFAVSPPAKAGVLHAYEYSLPRMGTLFRITLYSASQAEAGKSAMAAFERLEQLEESLSAFRDGSELVRLSREAVSAPRSVSPELFYVLDKSLQVSRLSGGAFDVTIGPLVEVWRQARRAKRLPDAAELAKAKAAVDYRNIELDPQARTVFLKRPDIKIDLGGIAKGYAAQQALELLAARGMRRALIDAGGDITLGAPPPGRAGWKIAIDDPSPEGQASPCTLVLHDVAIATSGDARQFVKVGGQRYSHIINPADGLGLKDSGSTTVIAPDGTMADALATALSVLPVSEGLRLIESVEGASAYIVRQTSPALAGWRRFSSRRFPQACDDVRQR
jgi:thiamine biosynthesis lipoprotein